MTDAKVSLYIPCFNSAATIGECLDAVFKQAHPPEEVLVIDDGSQDETVKIASRYHVKIIMHKNNRGLAAVRNTAIKNAQSEFVASLDADCVAQPDWLMRLMKRLKSQKTAGAGGRLLEKYSDTACNQWRSVHMKQEWGDKKSSPPFLFGSNTVFRRKALLKVGLYNEKFKTNYEDVDISARLKKKGWRLAYEPKAIACHLRNDDISSILNSYWRWNAAYYQKRELYANARGFVFKIKDNLGLANRYLEEDIACKRHNLIYLDFLLALHHSLRDLEYFSYRNNHRYPNYAPLSFWLSFIDLNFFYHFDSQKNKFSTLIPKKDAFLQNFFALNLIISKCIWARFKDYSMKRRLYRHLLLSVYGINDAILLDKLLNIVKSRQDWDDFFKKKHPNLNSLFLKNLLFNLETWLKNWVFHFPEIFKMIEVSAEKTDRFFIIKEGDSDED